MENKEKEILKQEKQKMFRHSMAHVLAKALRKLYPGVQLGIGPSIDTGFYYDIKMKHNLSPEDFEKIEAEMNAIISKGEEFTRKEISKAEALKLFADEKYKVELIEELEDGTISLYYLGEDFFDLCKGPHVENTNHLRGFAYKIDKVSGAYWRGSEKNDVMQRVYCLGFSDKKELKAHIKMLAEAERRDHRKLGKNLRIFEMLPEGPGFPFFLPNGMIIRNELENYWRELHKEYGYDEIKTPIMLSRELWEKSGHWSHYKENMYTSVIDDKDYAIKPMNCPGGMLVYNTDLHSYKELPIRTAELGLVHRHEMSGALHGLMRVRNFTQDDAHIFMTEAQIEEEVLGIMEMIDKTYSMFGFEYHLELSTKPEKAIGSDEVWETATNALEKALIASGKDYIINEGDGAFYGPKIDFHLKDCIGRTWQCGTIQLDFQLPERFDLTYIGADNKKHRPVMLHRVILGSVERFMGILIEHYAGIFPTWLSPNQVSVLPIAEKFNDYAKEVEAKLKTVNVRASSDLRNEPLGAKIKNAKAINTPYVAVVGERELEAGTVAVKYRGKDLGSIKLEEFIVAVKEMIVSKK